MKKILLFILIVLSIKSYSQNFDSMLYQKPIDCRDISYKSSIYFVKYMESNKFDSVKLLLKYWEEKCGTVSYVITAKVLFALKVNKYNDSLLGRFKLNYLLNYNTKLDQNNPFQSSVRYNTYDNLDSNYYKFCKKLAVSLKDKYNEGTTEKLLCEIYSNNGDSTISLLKNKKYENTLFYINYNENLKAELAQPKYCYALLIGNWMPLGSLSKVKNHVELGIQIGYKMKRINIEVPFLIRLNNIKTNYLARRTDTSITKEVSKKFTGVHIGIDIGYDVIQYKKHELQLKTGLGYDIVTVFEADKNNKNSKPTNIDSYAINIGFLYKYYFLSDYFVGIQTKYNIIDYTRNGVIDYKGNSLSITLLIGFVQSNTYRYNIYHRNNYYRY